VIIDPLEIVAMAIGEEDKAAKDGRLCGAPTP